MAEHIFKMDTYYYLLAIQLIPIHYNLFIYNIIT